MSPEVSTITAVAGDLSATLSTETAALERLHTEQTLPAHSDLCTEC